MSTGLPFPIEVGDKIRLNSKAPDWTRGRVFTVDKVKRHSVRCWAPPLAQDFTADWTEAAKTTAKAYLLVPFDQIEEPVK